MGNSKIAVIQCDGVEALLSSAPSFTSLKKRFPDSDLHLITTRSCLELSEFLGDVSSASVVEDALKMEFIDVVCLGAKEESQEAARHWKYRRPSDDWACYLLTENGHGAFSPYPILEIYRNLGEFTYDEIDYALLPSEAANGSVTQYLFEAPHIKLLVSVSAFADQESLRLFCEAVDRKNLNVGIYLIGTVKHRKLSKEFLDATNFSTKTRVVDLCGRLSCRETAAMAFLADIVISGPECLALLSSGFGTFTICLDGCEAHNPLLYPYGHGHLILQTKAAGVSMTAQALGDLLAGMVSNAILGAEGNVPNVHEWQEYFDSKIDDLLGKCRIFATQRVQSQYGEWFKTDLHLKPLLFTGAEFSDCMRGFYYLLWENSLNSLQATSYDLDPLHTDALTQLSATLKPLEQLFELGGFGVKYVEHVKQHITDKDLDLAKKESGKLEEVDRLIQLLKNTNPYLSPICDFYFMSQGRLETDNPLLLSDQIADCYRILQHHVLVLLDLQKSIFETAYARESRLQLSVVAEDPSNG